MNIHIGTSSVKQSNLSLLLKLYYFWVHLVLHPHGIASTLLKFNLLSPGVGFIPIISTKKINQIRKEKL